METSRRSYLFLVVAVGVAAALLWVGLMDAAPASAQGRAAGLSAQTRMHDPEIIDITIIFTDARNIDIRDLSGNVIGKGEHGGMVRCVTDRCSQKTSLSLTGGAEYEYRFTSLQALDPAAGRAVVGGEGKITTQGQKERFQFTAIFQDNRDGTLTVIYSASRPDASFIVRAPGRMRFQR